MSTWEILFGAIDVLFKSPREVLEGMPLLGTFRTYGAGWFGILLSMSFILIALETDFQVGTCLHANLACGYAHVQNAQTFLLFLSKKIIISSFYTSIKDTLHSKNVYTFNFKVYDSFHYHVESTINLIVDFDSLGFLSTAEVSWHLSLNILVFSGNLITWETRAPD